ncbi:MAG: hypothetical protein KatS3mg103_0492 [Phycisphaerales bacterium]|nr:MAG: hypothetical protein KatS3mg103_0492 [Phycisphaerales bacterium]
MIALGMPLQDVALATGFSSHSHFTQTFGSLLGQSPSSWRRQVAHTPQQAPPSPPHWGVMRPQRHAIGPRRGPNLARRLQTRPKPDESMGATRGPQRMPERDRTQHTLPARAAGGAQAQVPTGHDQPHRGLTEDERRLNERVRTLLDGGSITRLAATLGLNHESVRRYVRGTTSPPALFLLRLATRTDVDCRWLLTGQREPDEHALRSVATQALVRELERRLEPLRASSAAGAPAELQPEHRPTPDQDPTPTRPWDHARPATRCGSGSTRRLVSLAPAAGAPIVRCTVRPCRGVLDARGFRG